MKTIKTPSRIPKRLWYYFWDVDIKNLNPQEKPYFVINRLLDKGNVEAVRYVNQNFEKKLIEKTFIKMRDFRAKIGSFWSLFLQIPKERIACLDPHYLKMRRMHWPY